MKTFNSLLIGVGIFTTPLAMANNPAKTYSKIRYQNPPVEKVGDTIIKEELFMEEITL